MVSGLEMGRIGGDEVAIDGGFGGRRFVLGKTGFEGGGWQIFGDISIAWM